MKLIKIEYIEVTTNNDIAIKAFCGDNAILLHHYDDDVHKVYCYEGKKQAKISDYIIKYANGDIDVVDSERFNAVTSES